MLRTLLLATLLLLAHPTFAEENAMNDGYKAIDDIISVDLKHKNKNDCLINTKISFPLYHDKLPIFRSAFLNKDYSVDFYALRERQVLIYVVLKRVSEVITEAFYKDGKETAECSFLIFVDYIDKFGQSKDINVLT